ncbi:MAG: hypothetical protein HYW78_04815 [Parcubacteria group bacterium]|nr:hypothetical protein [Parcubacteria group bacterium]
MRKIITLVLIVALVSSFTIGCAESKVINGVEYQPYGLLDEKDVKDLKIQYKVSFGDIFWGVVGFETIFLPIYCFGFNLYEPIGPKAGVVGDK